MTPSAFWSPEDECWYVPIAGDVWKEAQEGKLVVEPARVELRDGLLWITRLEPGQPERQAENVKRHER